MSDCGGCNDLGAHTRWCPEVVGPKAARLGTEGDRADVMGDRLAFAPQLANLAYELSGKLWLAAAAEARQHRAGDA